MYIVVVVQGVHVQKVAISLVGRDEKSYWHDIEKLIRLQVKIVKDHPFPWRKSNPDAKRDFRNKKPTGRSASSQKSSSHSSKKSRKSESSKKIKRDGTKFHLTL